jgi:hypothetical protein
MSDGQLEIQIIEAVFERDVKTFGTMNPQYKITWKDTVLEGHAAEGGGKNPKWSHIRSLDVGHDYSNAGVITVVFTDDNDLIVQCELNVVDLCNAGNWRDWVNCYFEGQLQGKCEVKTVYHG